LSNQFTAELLVYLACAVSGWIVARLDREHAVAAVCLFSAAVLVLEYGMFGWIVATKPAPPDVPQTTMIVVSLVSLMSRPLAFLVGGLSTARNQHEDGSSMSPKFARADK
jgi:hypothetical protein